jgi:aminodeoxyfutalosine deaminase
VTSASPATLALLRKLPKAELHIHLEGTLRPQLLLALAKKYSVPLDMSEIQSRYRVRGFSHFLELYKWATTFLREPEDYALLAQDAAHAFKDQNVIYAEVTISIGVMLLRKQDVAANFAAIRGAFERSASAGQGPQVQFIFDAVRQFGPGPAMEVARFAAQQVQSRVVAFGLGGDEISVPLADFRGVYEFAAGRGLHLLVHAGETGGPEQIQDAIDILRAERIGHGIAAVRSDALINSLAERKIPLEICPTSNLCTRALNIQLNSSNAEISGHPLARLLRRGVPVTLSTDDPAMFDTTLFDEYLAACEMGLSLDELRQINRNAFAYAFLSEAARQSFFALL